jgi:hypothetical protein
MAFTEDGKVVADLQDPSGNFSLTTGSPKLQTGFISRMRTAAVWAGCHDRNSDQGRLRCSRPVQGIRLKGASSSGVGSQNTSQYGY